MAGTASFCNSTFDTPDSSTTDCGRISSPVKFFGKVDLSMKKSDSCPGVKLILNIFSVSHIVLSAKTGLYSSLSKRASQIVFRISCLMLVGTCLASSLSMYLESPRSIVLTSCKALFAR